MKKIIKYIICSIFLLLSIYLIYIVNKLNILPIKYYLPFIIVTIILNIIADICLLVKNKLLKIISVILYLILIVISYIGIKYGSDTLDFLDKAFNNHTYEITTYEVLVLNKSKIESIDDIKSMEYLSSDDNKDELINIMKSITSISLSNNDDIYKLYDNLIKGKVNAIVLDSVYIDVLSEELLVNEDTKTIYSFEIKHKKSVNTKEVKALTPINILVSGSDSRANTIYNKSRSDVNMILTINPDTNTILMTSIPRDYYVDIYNKKGLKDKLTHSGIYGVETTKKTIEELFDIKIDYYIKVNFNAVVELVDLVGGLDIYSDTEFDSYHYKGWHVEKGINHMDGMHALAYARERYAYKSGDNHRIMNQQQVLEATMKKVISNESILLRYDKTLNSLSKFYVTDIPKSVITLFVKRQLNNMPKWEFISIKVTGTGKMLPTYTAPNSKRWVMIPDMESVNTASKKINEVINS